MPKEQFLSYQKENHHPSQPPVLDAVGSVLNALCVTKGYTWKEAYCKLIAVAGKIGQMPQYPKTIRELLHEEGFFLQAKTNVNKCIREIIADCNRSFHDGEVVILNLSVGHTNTDDGEYCPLVPHDLGGQTKYALHFPQDNRDRIAHEVWVAWKDGQDHSPLPPQQSRTQRKELKLHTEENESLIVLNENPNDNYIGDCAVRAFAAVLEIPWAEAIKRLAEAQNYAATILNGEKNIEALLKKEGFEKFDAMKRNGKILTGKEFCSLIHDMFPAGTRIYAYSGRSHVVAILVFDGEYKIVDTWDSTNRKIIEYWAKYPQKPKRPRKTEAPAEKLTALSVGMTIQHKTFGNGKVTALSDTIATIQFAGGVEKKFAVAWVLGNCKPCETA